MQNKPNFQKSQMNISYVKTTNYEQKTMNYANKKQTQFKPNQSQFQKSQNEYKLNYNKGLQKKRWFRSPNKQTQFKACPERSRMGH